MGFFRKTVLCNAMGSLVTMSEGSGNCRISSCVIFIYRTWQATRRLIPAIASYHIDRNVETHDGIVQSNFDLSRQVLREIAYVYKLTLRLLPDSLSREERVDISILSRYLDRILRPREHWKNTAIKNSGITRRDIEISRQDSGSIQRVIQRAPG